MLNNTGEPKELKSLRALKHHINSIPTAEIAGKLGISLHKTGNSLQGECPSGHSSKSKTSFSINIKGNYWHCFNCNDGGDNISLVQLANKCYFKEAVQWACKHFSIKNTLEFKEPTPEEQQKEQLANIRSILYETAYKWMHSLLFEVEGKEAHYYLTENRKYNPDTLEATEFCAFQDVKKIRAYLIDQHPELESVIRDLPLSGAFGDEFDLAFPYRNRYGKITGFIKRSIEPEGVTVTMKDGRVKENQRYDSTYGLRKDDLFNLDKCSGQETLVVAEGYPDAIYFTALGMKNIAAVGQGRLSETHIDGLEHKNIKNVIISFDNDDVGPANSEQAVRMLLESSNITPYVLEPAQLEPHKDPDEYVKANGLDAFISLLNKASKGISWVVERTLAKAEDGSSLERQKCLDSVIEIAQRAKNPLDTEEIMALISKRLKLNKTVIKDLMKAASKNNRVSSPVTKGKFWVVENDGLKINMKDYIDYIIEEGFSKYYLEMDYTFIRTKANIVKECSLPQIKDYILSYVEQMEEDDLGTKRLLYETLYTHVGQYFNEGLIECIPPREIKFKRDGMEDATVYYKNGFVTLRRNADADVHSYDKLDSPIWGHLINERSIELLNKKDKRAEYEQFLLNVVRGNEDRFLSLCSAIGYLMHDFKQESNTKAVILCDQMISDNPNGRTGKSLIGKAIEKIKNVARVDGKNFEFQEKFTFQMVKLGTQIIDFNDVEAKFDFERLFSVITDSMTVEYKNKTPFTIPFSESPKLMLSTNYTIRGEGCSYKDRMFEIEFSDYYNAELKPKDDFGHDFFTGWDSEEWNRFDNFMLECLQLYLDEGLVRCAVVNLDQRKIIDQTSAQFVEFAEEFIQINTVYNLTHLFNAFKKHIGFEQDMWDRCPIKQNTFTKWLPVYAPFISAKFEKRASNGQQFVELKA